MPRVRWPHLRSGQEQQPVPSLFANAAGQEAQPGGEDGSSVRPCMATAPLLLLGWVEQTAIPQYAG